MLEEQEHALSLILDIAKKEAADGIVIAGDVFDRGVAPSEAVLLFDKFLADVASAGLFAVIIPGNHDSAVRLSYGGHFARRNNVYFCPENEKLVLADEHGSVNFYALPFTHDVRGFADTVSELGIDASERNVAVAHGFFLHAADLGEAAGGVEVIDPKCFSEFDYAALGHLHPPMSAGLPHVRYSGSLIKCSFAEWKHKKSVTVVNMGTKGDLSWTDVPLAPIHDMREIKGPLSALTDHSVCEPSDDYIRAILTDDIMPEDAVNRLRTLYKNLMLVERALPAHTADFSLPREEDLSLAPEELFGRFFEMQNDRTPSEEEQSVIASVFAELERSEQ